MISRRLWLQQGLIIYDEHPHRHEAVIGAPGRASVTGAIAIARFIRSDP